MITIQTRKMIAIVAMLLVLGFTVACGSTETVEPAAAADSTIEPAMAVDNAQEAKAQEAEAVQEIQLEETSDPETTATPDEQAEESAVPWPEPRLHPTMIYDPASQRIMMFSGLSRMQRKIDMREIWQYDAANGAWEHVDDVEPNDALISFGFDTESDRVVALNNLKRQTWAYDLESRAWIEMQPGEQPSEDGLPGRRFGALMAYDSESDRLILFGGGAPERLFDDTWAYDFNNDTWENMNPSRSPSPRAMYHMAYHPEADRVILWGGFMEEGTEDAQIWAYDYNSNSWESFANNNGPQQHWERGGMVYLPQLDRLLIFSGMREWEDVLVGPETWYYDFANNDWTRIDTENIPPAMAMYGMVYDPPTGQVVLYGGELESKYAANLNNDVWIFDPELENWSQVSAVP